MENLNHLFILTMFRLLVGKTTGGGFETLGGDKTHCFISRTRSLQQLEKLTIHTLSFSLSF
jgi:hypothetical protein